MQLSNKTLERLRGYRLRCSSARHRRKVHLLANDATNKSYKNIFTNRLGSNVSGGGEKLSSCLRRVARGLAPWSLFRDLVGRVSPEDGSGARVRPLLEQGPRRRGVRPRLCLVALGQTTRPRAPVDNMLEHSSFGRSGSLYKSGAGSHF